MGQVSKRARSFGAMECLVFLDALSRLHEGMPEASHRLPRHGFSMALRIRSCEHLAKNEMQMLWPEPLSLQDMVFMSESKPP